MKKLIVLGFALLLVATLFVSAEYDETNYGSSVTFSTIVAPNKPADNFIGRLISEINFNKQDFSVYGDELGCSVYPNDKIFLTYGDTGTFRAYENNVAFVNWFRGSPFDGAYPEHPTNSRQFIREDYITSSSPSSFTCDAGAYWLNECYGEIYYCSEPVCYSDQDCNRISLPLEVCDKSIISLKIPNAGVCESGQYTHKTEVYLCQGGKIIDSYEVSDGSLDFCKDSTTSRYYLLDQNTDHCLDYTPADCNNYVHPPTHSCGDSVCDADEDCTSCAKDCGSCPAPTPGNCRTAADDDCNGKISKLELRRYANRWISGELTREQLGVVLEAWGVDNE